MGEATALQLAGAFGFGALIGWCAFYLNRYRTDAIQLSDLAALIGAVGGGAILALFPAGSDLFGAYGVGLFTGFFGYLLILMVLVKRSEAFDWDFFLDGRRRRVDEDTHVAGDNLPQRAMGGSSSRPPDGEPDTTPSRTSTGIQG